MTREPAHMEILKQMLSISALSGEEGSRADYLSEVLEKLGHPVKRKNNNLLAGEFSEREDCFNLVLNSHMDTVPPVDGWSTDPFNPLEKDGCLVALGSNDAGASVVAMISAFHFLAARRSPVLNLVLLISAEEEISGERGLRAILPELGRVDGVIVGEPTGMLPAVAERGLMVLDGKVKGKAGHAARAEGVNAISLAMEDVAAISALQFTESSEWLPEPSAQVTMIKGGTKHNVVPDVCSYVMDVRSNDRYGNLELLKIIRGCCHAELSPRSTHLTSSGLNENHVLMKVVQACGLNAFGSSTLSDMALFPFPAIKMGPGDSARSHTAGEYIMPLEIEEGISSYVTYVGALEEILNKEVGL